MVLIGGLWRPQTVSDARGTAADLPGHMVTEIYPSFPALLASALPAWRAAGVNPWWRYATNEVMDDLFGMNFHCEMY